MQNLQFSMSNGKKLRFNFFGELKTIKSKLGVFKVFCDNVPFYQLQPLENMHIKPRRERMIKLVVVKAL